MKVFPTVAYYFACKKYLVNDIVSLLIDFTVTCGSVFVISSKN